MGIYDRDYIKEGRRGGGVSGARSAGAARLRMLSVTAWIIIANVIVFLVQLGLTNAGVPVHVSTKYRDGVTQQQVHNSKPITGYLAPTQNGMLAPASQALEKRVGVELFVTLGEVHTNGTVTPTGQARFWVMDPIEALGHFSTAKGFSELQVWRLVTFQFLHSGFDHILFNMFGLFIFGPLVEQQLGGRRFLAFYLTCGIFGGLMYLLLNLVGFLGLPLPGALHTDIWTPLIGASAGVFGVLMACAFIAPKAMVRLLFPPIALEMRWLVYTYFALAMWNLIVAGHNQGGDAAHVGGALAGFYFIRRPWLLHDFFDVFKDSRDKPPSDREGGKPHKSDREVDRILDKISDGGMQSLSERERKVLEQHSRRGNSG